MLFFLRLIGMVVAGVAGWQLGMVLAEVSRGGAMQAGQDESLRYVLVLSLAAAGLGLLLTPYATVVPLRRLWRFSHTAAAADLAGGAAGMLVGLMLAALAAFPISQLPEPLGRWLPAVVAIVLAWLGTAVGMSRKDELFRAVLTSWTGARQEGGLRGAALLDTSAIVDGRIVEVRRCGFVGGSLVVPRFVLDELQQLADSGDAQRRQRGRRGLHMLERLRDDVGIDVLDADFSDVRGVDGKLVRLARRERAAIVTTDYALNRVAGLQGVPVLNVNDLAQALRTVVEPGDALEIDVTQEGRERSQGVGFLDDGTMVVVEGGRRFLGQHVEAEVTRVLPTSGGRMVFAKLRERAAREEPGPSAAEESGPTGLDRGRLRVLRPPSGTDGD
jgi:uncharacterized protein YacL